MSLIRVQVFLMDTGSMYQVEASLGNKVALLKESISRITGIPVDQQVLLISGGAPLFDEKQLYKYESVSDNTVFLICKSTNQDINRPPTTSRLYSEPELQSQVQTALNLLSTKDTVRARMYLAQQICDIDQRELEDIEQMVYEQHLQQQGWACVVANLEDVSSGFGNRGAVFQMELVEFLKIREDILALLRRMPTVLTLLGKIPIVPSLEQEASKISTSQRGPLDKDCPFTPGQLTLYNWMNWQDSKHRLEDVIKDVSTGTDQLGYPLEESVQQEVQSVCRSVATNKALWVIKGLEDRLSGLDKLTRNAKSMVDMQVQTRKGFKLNWQRLETEKDNSILPDLCATHKNQLLELHTRHRKLKELKNKCTAAKQELSKTIQDRLPWMMQTHQSINAMNNTLWLHHDLLKRIRSRAAFLNQVEMAPQVYASMLVEVVRRRNFSREFLKWSTGVAEESKKEHKKEIQRRRAFTKQCGSHFLQRLFIGFKDHVPKFATDAPKNVDIDLPGVTTADIDYLSKEVPELQQMLRLDLGSPALGVSFQQSCGPGDHVSVSDPFLIDHAHFMGTSSSSSTSTTTSHSLTHTQGRPLHPPGPLMLGVGERLSLSCQAEGGERGGRRAEGGEAGASKGDDPRMFRSLQDGLLPVPQCLSETLTAEVNSAAMSTISVSVMSASPQSQEFISAVEYLPQQPLQHQSQQPQQQQQPPPPPLAQAQAPQEGPGGDGVLLSSGDLEPATKSSDSDVSEHKAPRCRRKQQHQHRGSVKGLLSDTSPDAETSQEFANTDFYIEDSMPSSITDSPPKTGAGFTGSAAKKGMGQVVSAALAEKTKRVDELEGEVSVLQSRLAGSQEKLASLGSSMVGLQESLGALRESVQQGDIRRQEELLRAQESLLRLCGAVREGVDREREEAVRREREGGRQTAEELEARYREKCQATKDLEQSMVRVSACTADLNHELHAQREASQREVSVLREQHQEEVRELKRQTVLEVELETDRLRTEMQATQDALEGQLLQLQEELHQTRQQLDQAVSDKESSAATLKQQFEDERRQLQASMEAERSQAVEQVRMAVRMEAEKEATSLLKKESQQSQVALTQQLEEMKGDHERRLAKMERELTTRHQAELDSLCQEWAGKLATQEADLTTEFELKQEALRKEMDIATPELIEAGSQSDDVSAMEQCTQSEASSFSVGADVAVQSEGREGRDCAVQWDDDDWVGVGEEGVTQTHPPPAMWTEEQGVQCDPQGQPPGMCDQDTQSEGTCLTHQATQSHRPPSVCEQGVQSDMSTLREQGVQSDSCCVLDQSVQSDSCCVLDQSIQSDGCETIETSVSVVEQSVEGQDAVSMERHQQLVSQTVDQTREQLTQQYEQMLALEREMAEERMVDMEEQHRRDKEEALSNCRSAVLAERQIKFNEAITSAVKGKDSQIDELTAKLQELSSRGGDAVEGEGESGDIRKQLASIKEKESHLKGEKQRLENEVLMLQQQLHQYSEQFHTMTTSAAPLSPLPADPMTHSSTEGAMARSTCSVPMETSMTASVRRESQGKVSILTCNVGDLVLLCLDERHDQYVVFTVGTTLHFLHSDCIDLLGLRPGEGEPRKNWVLAEVTDREYCQARKAQNRFKVPVNTKFYRVKAKPWVPKTCSTGN